MSNFRNPTGRFTLPNVALYLGGTIVLIALGYLPAWEDLSKGAIFAICATSSLVLFVVGTWVWFRVEGMKTPGGILVTLAVIMLPITLLSVLSLRGYGGGALHALWWMEVTMFIGALVAQRIVRFPLLAAPACAALWLQAVTCPGGGLLDSSTGEFCQNNIAVGCWMTSLSFLIDSDAEEDYAFWGYLFGVTAFWGGLTCLHNGSEVQTFQYFVINVFMVVMSAVLRRKVFLIYGALGCIVYLISITNYVLCSAKLLPFGNLKHL
jgi:hypothetical protein